MTFFRHMWYKYNFPIVIFTISGTALNQLVVIHSNIIVKILAGMTPTLAQSLEFLIGLCHGKIYSWPPH
jgi:hypothetical protein